MVKKAKKIKNTKEAVVSSLSLFLNFIRKGKKLVGFREYPVSW